MTIKEIITITGMSCAACAAVIEKTLRTQYGIDSAFVGLSTAAVSALCRREKVMGDP